jgi:hypothetical protein
VEYLNNISEEEIEFQGKLETSICCESCEYDTGWMDLKSAVFKINMQGGYFSYDGEGGPDSKCPACGFNTLINCN